MKRDSAGVEPQPVHHHAGRMVLTWGSLALAAAESICLAVVGLSGLRVAIGLTSLIAAAAHGPATGFHRGGLRIPLLAVGTLGALLSLFLLWNEHRLRSNPSAAWRLQPYTKSQKRQRVLQLWLAILTLAIVAGEVLTHPWFHHE